MLNFGNIPRAILLHRFVGSQTRRRAGQQKQHAEQRRLPRRAHRRYPPSKAVRGVSRARRTPCAARRKYCIRPSKQAAVSIDRKTGKTDARMPAIEQTENTTKPPVNAHRAASRAKSRERYANPAPDACVG